MGGRISTIGLREEGGESVADIVVTPARLEAARVDDSEIATMIDELPLLACLATQAHGETVITGAAELRVKESDRISAVVSNLRAIGANAEELSDGLRVGGPTRRLAGKITTHGDHRLAMAFGILGALPNNEIEIDDRDCVAVSYPEFWNDLARIRAS
jgi:3-phosphoshikimate 1-carboxyvinyltransferase